MSSVELQALLANLPSVTDPNLIVGFDTHDDAGVYRLTEELAVVVTADFITPPTDDPVLFGKIAAANALSDVYAMGGRPITCVNLVCFPSKKLASDVLAGIISGARQTIDEAGAVLAGGHTVEDPEPKFGLAVTGIVHPDKCWTNSGAHSGDALVLTKPVGSGVILNANLKGWVSDPELSACIEELANLNRRAAEVAAEFNIHAATDVTGFGLAGHALEMAQGSSLRFQLDFNKVPLFEGAAAMYKKGMTTGSNASNRETAVSGMEIAARLSPVDEELLFDPQTNGGLLFALAEDQADELVRRLREAGVDAAARIGTVSKHPGGPLLQIC